MRRLISVPLLPLLAWGCSDGVTGPPVGGDIPEVGDIVAYNVEPTCNANERDERVGRVVAVTERAIVVVDQDNPSNGLSDAEYAGFGQSFDEIAYPVVVDNFGTPTDIDENGRVIIFFTRAVNGLSEPNGRSFVSGFFWPGDLFPHQTSGGLQGCPNSNFAEIFYLAVPDPNGQAGPRVSREQIRRTSVTTMGHELQHLVNSARRLYVNRSTAFNEEVWLNEGLSHAAEELMFYRITELGPGSNLDGDALTPTSAGVFNDFQAGNLLRLAGLLQETEAEESSLLHSTAPLPSRGGIWSFLRYAADRRGGSQRDFWYGLVNTDRAGLGNLEESIGASPFSWMQDWSTALYAADKVPVEARYDFPSWNLRNLYSMFRDQSGNQVFLDYPLNIRGLGNQSPINVSVSGSATSYARLRVAASGEAEVAVTSGGAPPPDELRLSVVNRETGAVFHRQGDAAGAISLSGGDQETDYVLIVLNSSSAPDGALQVELSSEGASLLAFGSGSPALIRSESLAELVFEGAAAVDEALELDRDFHLELHERAWRELAPLVADARRAYRNRAFDGVTR